MRLRTLTAVAWACVSSVLVHAEAALDVAALRDEARSMWHHAYDSYLAHAYPWDELKPLACSGRRWDKRTRGTLDDSLGGYKLTLVDALDGLLLQRDSERFADALRRLQGDGAHEGLDFDRDVDVSVFEATIRVVGGLLSAHTLAVRFPEVAEAYDGTFFLERARDLGTRLLPAFDTPTGLPLHRVNLRRGALASESKETCTAAAGSLLLELGELSRLTGDPTFEAAARRAVDALWGRRSEHELVGTTVHTHTGRWLQTATGIGAGVDSFFEYLLKAYHLTGEQELLDRFDTAYAAANRHTTWRGYNVQVHMDHGSATARPTPPGGGKPHPSHRVSALQGFWPALQVLAGDVGPAERTYGKLVGVWRRFDAMPELYDVMADALVHYGRDAPLRPELIESAFHLYGATGARRYLTDGRDFLFALQNTSRVPCGYAAVADVTTGRLDDRMDSYVLAETLKYLYLLFDSALPPAERESLFCAHERGRVVNAPCFEAAHTVWTTEGHVLVNSKGRRAEAHAAAADRQCANATATATEAAEVGAGGPAGQGAVRSAFGEVSV